MHTKAGFHITAAIFEGEGATILPIAGKWGPRDHYDH